jgi:hypothetical protein
MRLTRIHGVARFDTSVTMTRAWRSSCAAATFPGSGSSRRRSPGPPGSRTSWRLPGRHAGTAGPAGSRPRGRRSSRADVRSNFGLALRAYADGVARALQRLDVEVPRGRGAMHKEIMGGVDTPVFADDEVLVRVHAAGVDQGVWHLMAGCLSGARRGRRAPRSQLMAGSARPARPLAARPAAIASVVVRPESTRKGGERVARTHRRCG